MAPDADLTPSLLRRITEPPPEAASPFAIIEIEPNALPPPPDGYVDLVLDDGEVPAVAPSREVAADRSRTVGPDPEPVARPEAVARASAARERSAPRLLVPEALLLAAFLVVSGVTAIVAHGRQAGRDAAPADAARPPAALDRPASSARPAARASWRAPRPAIDIPPLEPAPTPPVRGIVALETPPPPVRGIVALETPPPPEHGAR